MKSRAVRRTVSNDYAEVYDDEGRVIGFGTPRHWCTINHRLFLDAWREYEERRQAIEVWEAEGGR